MTVMSIEWISGQEEAEAKVGAFSDGIAANWNILRIVFKEGRWIVKSDKLDAFLTTGIVLRVKPPSILQPMNPNWELESCFAAERATDHTALPRERPTMNRLT